jgi:hypothetical protein
VSLRLTLRTLLAYLDDTLEPAQARLIGQKVAESESARELVERIKQVTRRRRLTTPPTSGPGGVIDPNTVAEYLDNEVTPEQAAEVEQICLSSDVHLAEVAACHQILTLILGEPINPPATANQRMVGLVKGPEAIPARKPAPAKLKSNSEPYSESKDIDETLRLGLPPLARTDGWRNPLMLIGGGFLAAILLVVAVFELLHLSEKETENNAILVAQGKDHPKDEKSDSSIDKNDSTAVADKKSSGDKQVGEDTDKKADQSNVEAKEPIAAIADIPFGAPNLRAAPIGNYLGDTKDYSVLLQSNPAKKIDWKRLTGQKSEVYSAQPLLSMPGSKSVVQTNRGVRVTLWGNMTPEFIYVFPGFFESKVELYEHDEFDLDLLLQRGRVLLTSTRSNRPVLIRLRFDNPLMPTDKDLKDRQQHFDIKLPAKGATIVVDSGSFFQATEPFYRNPKNPTRLGPVAFLGILVLEGPVVIKSGDVTFTMTEPPGTAVMAWNSIEGIKPQSLKQLPDYMSNNPPPLPGLDPKARKDMFKALENLSAQLVNKEVDVGLANALKAPDPALRRLAVRSLAAVGDISSLLDALDQPNNDDLRIQSHMALRDWIAASRDNDYKLFDLLKEKYKNKEAEIIMDLLHPFSPAQLSRPGLYELLIDYLVNSNLVIRELGQWHLYRLVPAGKIIPYAAAADSLVRERAEAQWRALIPSGQLPPTVAPAGKKK